MTNIQELAKSRSTRDKTREKIKPVVIRTINDIRRAVIPFTKEVRKENVEVSSEVEWTDEDGKKVKSSVTARSSEVNMRQNLLDGFNQVLEQDKLWHDIHDVLEEDEYGPSLPNANIDDFHMPVDRIIKHRLGGKREGKTVVWEVEGKKVVFDPYSKNLEII